MIPTIIRSKQKDGLQHVVITVTSPEKLAVYGDTYLVHPNGRTTLDYSSEFSSETVAIEWWAKQ